MLNVCCKSFVSRLNGAPGRQCRYANPQTVQKALRIALSVQEAEKQERFKRSSYTRFESSVRLQSRPPNRKRDECEKLRYSSVTGAASNTNSQRPTVHKKTSQSTRNARTIEALRRYECQGLGHYIRECLTRLRRQEGYSL
jgi:hypothetical protein